MVNSLRHVKKKSWCLNAFEGFFCFCWTQKMIIKVPFPPHVFVLTIFFPSFLPHHTLPFSSSNWKQQRRVLLRKRRKDFRLKLNYKIASVWSWREKKWWVLHVGFLLWLHTVSNAFSSDFPHRQVLKGLHRFCRRLENAPALHLLAT